MTHNENWIITQRSFLSIAMGLLAAHTVIRILATVVERTSNFIMMKLGQEAVTALENRIYEHVLRLPLSFFRDALKGGVARAFDRGTVGVMLLGINTLRSVGPILIELLITAVVLALSFGLTLAIAAILSFVLYVLVTHHWNQQLFATLGQVVQNDEEIAERVVEGLSLGETIKSLAGVEQEASQFQIKNNRLRDSKISLDRISRKMGIFAPVSQFLILFVLSALMIWQIGQGHATAGEFVAFVTILRNLFDPMLRLLQEYQSSLAHERDSAKFLSFLDLKQESDIGGPACSLNLSLPALRIENLHFRFPEREALFTDFSLKIEAQQEIAFVGPSGSGKSSLGLLITRLEQGYEGQINVFETPNQSLPLNQLRGLVALTAQFTQLRAGTIYENLRIGNLEADDRAIKDAAKAACLHDFIASLPEGYDTKIGEGGQKLSGGERQRLAIARTLLREGAEVYIFDEATSALDLTTEALVMANIREKLAGKTLIFIAHRLTTIQHVDQIFVLDQGKLVEQGSHDDLLALGGTYEQLWNTQDV